VACSIHCDIAGTAPRLGGVCTGADGMFYEGAPCPANPAKNIKWEHTFMARSGGGLELNPCRLLEDRVDRVGVKLRRWGDFACTVSKACRGSWARVIIDQLCIWHPKCVRSIGHPLIYSPTKCCNTKMESAESDVRSSSHSNRSFTVACAAGSQRGAHRALTHSHTHTLIHTY
jgi:hypothetical protein